jgi:hypothetical protein
VTAVDDKQLVMLGGYKESDDAIYKEIAVLHTGACKSPPPLSLCSATSLLA